MHASLKKKIFFISGWLKCLQHMASSVCVITASAVATMWDINLFIIIIFIPLGVLFPRVKCDKNRAAVAIGPDRPGTRRCCSEELH